MKFRRQISFAVVFILALFLTAFSILMYVGEVSFRLKDLKNQSTQLLVYMYRLNFEIKSILTATATTTPELRKELLETEGRFERTLDQVESNALRLLADPELSASLEGARALWNATRRDLDLISSHLLKLSDLGIDKKIGFLSRSQYGYLLLRQEYNPGLEHYYLLSLENAIESFAATSYTYSLVFSNLSENIAASAGSYIRYSVITSIVTILIVVSSALVFFFLFGHQALVRQLDHLIDDALLKEQGKRDAELRALRYQINPHFLYNTLGSIRTVAMEKGQEEISEMLRVVSRLLRNTISRTDTMVSVAEERQIISDYLAILQMRYNNSLNIDLRFEEAVNELFMPIMIVQPIIENAVLHGLSSRLNRPEGEAWLTIVAGLHHASLLIEIRDNGIGMDEEEIRSAFSGMPHESNHAGAHIGILNINERIQRQFGKGYGLSITGRKGEFTSVRIRLPLLRDAQAHGN